MSLTNDLIDGYRGILTNDFIDKYKDIQPPMTELGQFVYYRTYSRWLQSRREIWMETVRRAVDYNCSLAPGVTKQEATMLYDNIFNLRQFLSGRTLWVGGTPVASKYPMSNFNCFRRDTEFLTLEGLKTFQDFNNGDMTKVLNANGAWSDAIIRNYGRAELYEMTIKKGSRTDIIYTTDNHLWFVRKSRNERKYVLRETENLRIGSILREKCRSQADRLVPSKIGIMHGMVFGDGTYDRKKNHCRIHLCGDKRELVQYFLDGTVCTAGNIDQLVVYGLPADWKQLPNINMNIEYLYGFLIGLLATDGHCGTGTSISNKSRDVIEYIRSIAALCGIRTGKSRIISNSSSFGDGYEPRWAVTLERQDIRECMLLRKVHLDNFRKSKSMEQIWRVEKVVQTGIYEDIWCVEEPETHAFTLGNGVLTHNCAGIVVDDMEAFTDLFYLLMVGTGVGFRILKRDVMRLPPFRADVDVSFTRMSPVPAGSGREITTFTVQDGTAIIDVGDSKEGWVYALGLYLDILTKHGYRSIRSVVFVTDQVRPRGSKLLTFGGTSSGYESLVAMFGKISGFIRSAGDSVGYVKLRPIHCLDIMNVIGENITVGGVRRTSEIALIDPDDDECINAKRGIMNRSDINHRAMSNNTIFFEERPLRERLHHIFTIMQYEGEPAFLNARAARARFPEFEVINPCAEVLLPDRGLCNLTTVNICAFVWGRRLNIDLLIQAQRLSVRAAMRMTMVTMELHKWDEVQKKHKLTGCSLTGWQDAMAACGISGSMQTRIRRHLRNVAIKEASEYARELGIPTPALVTTIKPEGTLSQLPTVSCGAHFSHGTHFIRRVRINAHDPLAKVVEHLGWPILPEVRQDWDTCTTKVIEFPVKSSCKTISDDIPAVTQLDIYRMFQRDYTQHNTSNTINVKPTEWSDVERWVWDNWDDFVAVAFLQSTGHVYELAPYQSISESEYNHRVANMKPFDPMLLNEIGGADFDTGTDAECSNGICPIR